jgi:hypothetical protein
VERFFVDLELFAIRGVQQLWRRELVTFTDFRQLKLLLWYWWFFWGFAYGLLIDFFFK